MSEKKIPEYHQSSIGMFLKCPRQFMYRYLMNLVRPPAASLTLGKAFDAGVTVNFKQKIESKVDAPVDMMKDAFSDSFERDSIQTVWEEDEKPGELKDQGIKMLEFFHKEAAPKIQPVTVQESFLIETDRGYNLGGTLDLTDENRFIRDTKTSAKSYQEDAVSDSIQAAMYDFAHEAKTGEKPAGFIFDVVTKTKVPKYQEIKGQVSQNQRERLFDSVNIMHKQINAGDFQYAAEGAWWCSKDWCGYWSLCKGKKL